MLLGSGWGPCAATAPQAAAGRAHTCDTAYSHLPSIAPSPQEANYFHSAPTLDSDDDSIRLYSTSSGERGEVLFSKKYGVQNICFTHHPSNVLYATRKVWGAPTGDGTLSER